MPGEKTYDELSNFSRDIYFLKNQIKSLRK